MFKWKLHYSLYDKHTHVHNHVLIYVLRHILFDQDQHNQRRSRVHVCAYNAQTCVCIHNPDRKWERERETERRQRRICQSRRDTHAHSHITASPITALPAPADWSEVKVILFRTAKQCVTLQHDSLSLGEGWISSVISLLQYHTSSAANSQTRWNLYVFVCNVISYFCFSTHRPVCFDQWDGISDELWKDFCASFTFILFLPPKMDFFNLNKVFSAPLLQFFWCHWQPLVGNS